MQEKDRPILQYLSNIRCNLHDEGFGYDLIFEFEKNDYFEGTELTKSFKMEKNNVIEKCEGSEIKWAEGRDPTKKKVKKKQNNKKTKEKRTITKIVPCESFFNFFSNEDPMAAADKEEGEDGGKESDS